MAKPIASVFVDSPDESFGDTIDIGVDVTHLMPEELRDLRDSVEVVEAERATLRATIRSMRAVEINLRDRLSDERQTDIRAIRILLAIVAFYDYEIWQMDVKTAFLNDHLSEDVYMVQPEGFVDPKHPKKESRPGRYPIRAFPFDFSRATCRPGNTSTVALNCLTKICGPGVVAQESRPGRYLIRAFPFDFSRATCHPGKSSPATSRPGFPGIVAGENGKCCSVSFIILS
nr:putative zinc finger, CCHC-type [Tanacetum cinerariifolium]